MRTERIFTLWSLYKALHLEEKEAVFCSLSGTSKSASDGIEVGQHSVHSDYV